MHARNFSPISPIYTYILKGRFIFYLYTFTTLFKYEKYNVRQNFNVQAEIPTYHVIWLFVIEKKPKKTIIIIIKKSQEFLIFCTRPFYRFTTVLYNPVIPNPVMMIIIFFFNP